MSKEKSADTKRCGLCYGSGRPQGYVLKNGNPCVRCGGYKTIPISCNNPVGLTSREEEQVKIENGERRKEKYDEFVRK
jgi:hypothetical protein